jgi:dephospho-CoA kinase
VLVLDAIRLIEAGLADRCDTVWVVICDRAAQMQRLQAARAMTEEQAAVRIAAQTPADAKIARANAVITNDGNLEDLAAQVAATWQETVAPRLG